MVWDRLDDAVNAIAEHAAEWGRHPLGNVKEGGQGSWGIITV
jgi:hypothetical protein